MRTRDQVPHQHDAQLMTVRELREAIGDANDDSLVMFYASRKPWTVRTEGFIAYTGAEVFPANRHSATGTLVLTGGQPPGRYMRPRPGWLVVEHAELTNDAAEHLQQVVDAAVSATGYRGSRVVDSPGSVTTWQWESHEDVQVVDVVSAAAAAVSSLNPGMWVVSSATG